MLRILHTADWHIGKQLYKRALYDDFLLFLEELKTILIQEKINLLLITGDVFDLANPSNRDKEIYYGFLADLIQMNIHVIITSGNHDSARMLEAPHALLKNLNIDVIGTCHSRDLLIPIYKEGAQGPKTSPEAIVLAVPFLREKDVRNTIAGESEDQKIQALRDGIGTFYKNLQQEVKQKFPDVPIIAMGHLYMQGASISDSERDIQIGNQAGLAVENYCDLFDYFALGHIHKPQRIGGDTIQYSGSPISLSFSERKDEKRIVILEIDGGAIKKIESRKLQKYRELKQFKGRFSEILDKFNSYSSSSPLQSYIEIIVEEEHSDPNIQLQLVEWAHQEHEQGKIIRYKLHYKKEKHPWENTFEKHLEDLKPIEVFNKKLDENNIDETQKKELRTIFNQLLDMWSEKEGYAD